ncbi:MAG: gfo/Idh/MocA family oxidoreductase, partial [Hymenobacter sp.]
MPYPPLRILVVGCGNMGASHARAYHTLDGFELVGLVSRGPSKHTLNAQLGGGYAVFEDYADALHRTQPDAVCLATYPDTHESFAVQALAAGCHIFLEKP